MNVCKRLLVGCLLLGSLFAQGQRDPGKVDPDASAPAASAPSAAAQAALQQALQLAKACKGKRGDARTRALSAAARAFDEVASAFAGEPAVVARASWSAAELWRRHGSLVEAERRYLNAAQRDAERYAQRALLGAADMQRRTERSELAAETYGECIAVAPRSRRAHRARLWIGRMLLQDGAVDAAVERLQEAFREAPSPGASIEAADHLAKAWLAKGDLESAGYCIEHAADTVAAAEAAAEADGGDPAVADRLRRAYEAMTSRRALQRERDRVNGALDDAIRLDRHQRTRDDG